MLFTLVLILREVRTLQGLLNLEIMAEEGRILWVRERKEESLCERRVECKRVKREEEV